MNLSAELFFVSGGGTNQLFFPAFRMEQSALFPLSASGHPPEGWRRWSQICALQEGIWNSALQDTKQS